MARLSAIILVALGCTVATTISAETLQMGGTENAARFEHAGKPSRGMSQARVEATYGSPQQAHTAVGDPPITRWDYAEFVVFFEYDRVIHSVTRR
ncbi:MAG: hypothetical protein KJO31_07700 [Gammaproteobacteria bacterium]|nr:hypothetical protein [Gammaproteobacteria bacterium]